MGLLLKLLFVCLLGLVLLGSQSSHFQTLRDLTTSLRDMKNYVNEIFTRTYNMEQRANQQVGGGGAVVPQQDAAIKQYLENIQSDIRQVRTAQIAQVCSFTEPAKYE